jgi:hypothetical protein
MRRARHQTVNGAAQFSPYYAQAFSAADQQWDFS